MNITGQEPLSKIEKQSMLAALKKVKLDLKKKQFHRKATDSNFFYFEIDSWLKCLKCLQNIAQETHSKMRQE